LTPCSTMSFWTLVIVLVLEAASPADACTHHDQCSDIFEDCCEGWMTCNAGYYPVETGTCAWGTLTQYKCCSNEDVLDDVEDAIGGLVGIIVGGSVGGGLACCACCALAYFLSNKNKKKQRAHTEANSSAPPQPAVQMGAVGMAAAPMQGQQPQVATAVAVPMSTCVGHINIAVPPTGNKFDPTTGAPLPKFDPQTGKQNW